LGAILSASVAINDDCDDTDIALLWAGALATERLGGDRRRGAGRCRMSFDDQAPLKWAQARKLLSGDGERSAPIAPENLLTPEPESKSAPPAAGANTWTPATFALELLAPVVARARAVGNVVESLDHVPGTTMLAALAPHLRAAGVDVGEAVRSGDVVVTDAYPEVGGVAGLPTPSCYRTVKDTEGFLTAGGALNTFMPGPTTDGDGQTQQVRGGYIGFVSAGSLPAHRPHRAGVGAATHNTIVDELQRPDETVGGVYTYESIRAGTTLRFSVLLRGQDSAYVAAKLTHDLDNTELRVGTSKKDGYGLARVRTIDAEPATDPQHGAGTNNEISAWCVSDLALVDHALRPTTTAAAFGAELGTALGCKLEPIDDHVTLRTTRRDGFHGRWGLPKASLAAIAAGSVARFRIVGAPPATVTPEVWLGERCAEGLGHVLVNHPALDLALGQLAPATTPPSGTSTPSGHDPRTDSEPDGFVICVAAEVWKALITEKTYRALGELAGGQVSNGHTTNTQVGALREALRRVESFDVANPGADWLAGLRAVPNRARLWTKQEIEFLTQTLTTQHKIWEVLGASDWPDGGGTARATLEHSLWGDAVRTLLVEAARHGLLGKLSVANETRNGVR